MPKTAVTDPITDQEIAFARLLLSGTMNDREAAEAAGLNPTTAAYTKSKPRVRKYMEEHRAGVKEQLINQEAEGLRKVCLARDQIQGRILDRLWELANLPHEATKGSITGQVKAIAMIAAIEGLLQDRRRSPGPGRFAVPAVQPQIYVSEWRREHKDEATGSKESVTAVEAKSATPPEPETPPKPASDAPSVHEDHDPTTQEDPFKGVSWAPNAIGPNLDTYGQTTSPLRRPFTPWKNPFGRGR